MTKLLLLLLITVLGIVQVSAYVVTWTGDDELTTTKRPLLGQKMCTRGPAYWCHNITHAKECHAVHHCISKVWEDMVLPEDNDSVCQICKDMVQQARDQLLSNETQDELRQVLEGSCRLIPLKIIANECVQLSDEFIPELVDTLASRMDPQAVCSVSGLCNSIRIDEMLGELKPIDTANPVRRQKKFDLSQDSCPKCNHYLGKAVNFLRGMGEDDLEEKIFEVCGRLGSYSDSCRALVVTKMDSIYSHVQSQMNSQEMCGLIGLCEVTSFYRVGLGKSPTAVRVWTPTQDDDLPCDFCKQLVDHLKDWLISNTTKGEFRDILRGLCKQTGSFRKECLNLVQQYGKAVYQLLIDETDPDRVCGMIGVCPNQGKFQLFGPQATIPLLALTPAEQVNGNEEDNDIETMPLLGIMPGERLTGDDERNAILGKDKVKGKGECEFCEYVLHYLQTYMEDPKTEEKMRLAVDKLCNELLPSELATQCNDFVNDYGNSMIVLLAQQIDPSVICPQLGVCAALGSTADDKRVTIVKTDHRSKVTDIPTCPLCHFAVSEIVHMIGENRTKEAIDHALDNVCYILPRTVKSKCINFMTYYGNQIGEMLVIQLTAREICMALGLCLLPVTKDTNRIIPPAAASQPGKIIVDAMLPLDRFMPQTIMTGEIERLKQTYPGLSSRLTPESSVDKGEQCVICEFAISQIAQRLKNNATEEEIKDAVERCCTYLPKTVRAQCKDFVDSYSDLVITYLAQSLDPNEVCTKLGLCNQNSTVVAAFAEALQKLDKIQDVSMGKCQLCMVLSDYLSAMLEDPKVETSVDRIVEKICPVMPQRYRSECKEMVEDYGPYLLSLLAQATDHGKACNTLSLCPSTPPAQ